MCGVFVDNFSARGPCFVRDTKTKTCLQSQPVLRTMGSADTAGATRKHAALTAAKTDWEVNLR